MALSFFKIQRKIYILLFLLYFPVIINAQTFDMNVNNIIDLGSPTAVTKIEATKKIVIAVLIIIYWEYSKVQQIVLFQMDFQ